MDYYNPGSSSSYRGSGGSNDRHPQQRVSRGVPSYHRPMGAGGSTADGDRSVSSNMSYDNSRSTASSRKRNSSNISVSSGSRRSTAGKNRGGGDIMQNRLAQHPLQNQNEPNTPSDPLAKLELLLNTINNAIFPHDDRLSIIAESLYEFDHRDKQQHDLELQYGSANIFFQKLAFAVNLTHGMKPCSARSGGRRGPSPAETQADHEIALICTALEMIHRASDHVIERSFEEIGRDILPLILKVINRAFDPEELNIRFQNGIPLVSKDRKIAVQKITKVIAAYSLVPNAKIPLAHTKNLLATLVKVIDVTGYNRMLPDSYGLGANGVRGSRSGTGLLMTEAARFNAIATLTNLAFAQGNRMQMMTEPGLVVSISMVANSSNSEMARQCAALAIMNLSNGDDDTVPSLKDNEFLLDTLVSLMEDPRPETRRNAAIAIYNFANSDENSTYLARYGDGVILELLLQIIVSTDTIFWNDHSRANASETLFNMSCSTNASTTDRMANHPGLLDSLASVLKQGSAFIDVMMYCAATLRRLAELIFPPSPCHGVLLSSLVKASNWTKTDCIAQALDHQASKPENRQIVVMHYGLLNALGRYATTVPSQSKPNADDSSDESSKIRVAALGAIEKLSHEPVTRPIMSKNELIMMALTRASYYDEQTPNKEDHDGVDMKAKNAESVKSALKNLVATM